MNHLDSTKRHDAIALFDFTDSNPNGDPDDNNRPRSDFETNQGLITDACIKRQIRNYIQFISKDFSDPERYKIFIEQGSILNDTLERAYTELDLKKSKDKKGMEAKNKRLAQVWLAENFYDIRTFGGVLETGDYKANNVQGPVQFGFGRSIDPIFHQSHTVSRCAATKEDKTKDNKTLGKKETINYGLYKFPVFYSPHIKQDSFSDRDLELFWQALEYCWEYNRSAGRGLVSCRGIYVFTHEKKFGSAHSHQLFNLIQIEKNTEIPRQFSDYTVTVGKPPEGVTLTQLCT